MQFAVTKAAGKSLRVTQYPLFSLGRLVHEGATSPILHFIREDGGVPAAAAELPAHRLGPHGAGGAARLPQLQDQEPLQ